MTCPIRTWHRHDDLPEIRTIRQLAEELVYLGAVTDEQAGRVITVHSMSKTDCLAGARLAVVEIRERRPLSAFQAHQRPDPAKCGGRLHLLPLLPPGRRQPCAPTGACAISSSTSARTPCSRPWPTCRMSAIRSASAILPPAGSMYPLLSIRLLPAGLSLDWLASGLARQGIGMLPLATFARTEEGFETARRTFRLTSAGQTAPTCWQTRPAACSSTSTA